MRYLLISVVVAASVGPSVLAANKSVQFVVLVPDVAREQPARIHLSSSADQWDEKGRPLERVAPGVYAATFEFPGGQSVEYKFTREGSWATVEKTRSGAELPNRTLAVDDTLAEQVVVVRVERWADRDPPARRRVEFVPAADATPPASQPARPPSRTSTLNGDIRYHHAIHSPQLNNDRTLIVYLPPGYGDSPSERYPVLYMHDGQNVFDAASASSGVEWGADETAERLIREKKIPKLIIVGIYNNADRMQEYVPACAGAAGGGNGDAYLAFIVETVKPLIDKTYRTQPDRAHTGTAGSSLGAMISLYAGYRYPEVFGRIGALSLVFPWGERSLQKYIQEHKPESPPRLWFDMGTKEAIERGPEVAARLVQDCRDLAEMLQASGYRPGVDFHFDEVAGGRHHEADWARRLDAVLQFLFPVTPATTP